LPQPIKLYSGGKLFCSIRKKRLESHLRVGWEEAENQIRSKEWKRMVRKRD
jgi:hypothetical protein